ncbi:MAG: 30S ribosomal protein S5 alanine N-acetyltransferase, partial [Bradyrhizobium sp.]|nr:30S ribosomal protein S5 alanine N-acetyltransferase [Bradyrhizobium sp.]
MALFRLPSSGPAALVPRGHGLLLRAPQMADFLQWPQLRESSRAYLTPWE